MTLFDHPLISQRYFFPRRDAPRELFRIEVDGATLACARHRESDERPLLVHFHGNGETIADYVPHAAQRFASIGIDTLFAEYRGYGASTGTPQLGRMLEDVEWVLEATRTPPERLFVYGRSIGSIYAIEAVRRWPSIAGLVIESGIHDVLERVLLRVHPAEIGATREEIEREAKARFDHAAKLGAYPGRVLVLHAERDRTIDRSHAERNARAARNASLVVFPRGDHNSIVAENLDAIFDAVHSFVHPRAM